MTDKSPPAKSRLLRIVGTGVGAVFVLLVVAAVVVVWVRSGPAFSEDEVAEADAALDAVRAQVAEAQCTRPALPDLATGSAASISLETLVDEAGPFAACLRAADQEGLGDTLSSGIVPGPGGEIRDWGYDSPSTEETPPDPGNRSYLAPQHPPFREAEEPAAYREIEAACGGLTEAVTALAAEEAGCSPFGPDTPGWTDGPSGLIPLARAISVVARGIARRGDLEGALKLLVAGLAVFQDARRGPTALLTAMLSTASSGIAASTFNALLIPEPGPSSTERLVLSSAIDQLSASSPHPHHTFAGEALAALELDDLAGETNPDVPVPELADDQDLEDLRAMIQVTWGRVAAALDEGCPRSAEATGCFRAVPDRGVPEVEAPNQIWELIVGPKAALRSEVELQFERLQRHHRDYYLRLLGTATALRQLKVMLALTGERQEGRCPTDAQIPADLVRVPGSSEPITITHLADAQYEVTAPRVDGQPEFERMVILTLCPGAGGRWLDEDTGEDLGPHDHDHGELPPGVESEMR